LYFITFAPWQVILRLHFLSTLQIIFLKRNFCFFEAGNDYIATHVGNPNIYKHTFFPDGIQCKTLLMIWSFQHILSDAEVVLICYS